MILHAQTSCFHTSTNAIRHNEGSSGVTLTPRNPSKPQSLKTLSAPTRQNREPPSSSDGNKLQEPTLQRTPMKLCIQPERETDDEYENEADDDICLFSQQPFFSAPQGLEENPFDENEDVFINNYQSDN